MSETTTAERVDQQEENLIDAAARAERERQGKQLETANPAAAGFEEFQLAVRRMLGLEDASDGEMRLFWHLCLKSGLDPFNREIYMIGRNTEVGTYEPVDPNQPDGQKRKVMRWVTKYTVQVGINGFRKRAREIADGKGIDLEMSEPLWCGDDEVWRQVWPEMKHPTASKFTVYRDGKPFTFIAHYGEYVQYTGAGEPTSMWKKMPRNQIRKCAEANAIQMAFPDELGGLILEDAAQPDLIVDQDGKVQEPAPRRPGGAGVDGMRAARERREAQRQQPTVVDAEPAEPAPPTPTGNQQTMSPPTRKKWLNRMFQLLNDEGEGDCQDRDDQLIVIVGTAAAAGIPGLVLEHRDGLTDDQLRAVVNQMNAWSKGKRLAHEVTEILNKASLAELAAEQAAADAAAAAAEAAADEASENAEADLAAREAEAEGGDA
jgi:phage recombination protein Bet